MARLAIFASGNGSNFQAIAERVLQTQHTLEFLLCNNKNARVIERAKKMGIPYYTVTYRGKTRKEVEETILNYLSKHRIDLIVLAGYMKIITEKLINPYWKRIVNIHPALLPKFPGTNAIERSYKSTDKKLGITIHYVDRGIDTGPIILQKAFTRKGDESLEEIEKRIHRLEHLYYPQVVIELLDRIGEKN